MFLTLPTLATAAFDLLDDLRLDFGRGGARLIDRDLDQRKGDVRAQVDGQADEGDHAHEEQHHEQHHRRHRVPDRPRRNVLDHLRACCAVCGAISTASPSRRNPPAIVITRSLPCRPSPMTTPPSVRVGDAHRATLDLVRSVDDIDVAALQIGENRGLRQHRALACRPRPRRARTRRAARPDPPRARCGPHPAGSWDRSPHRAGAPCRRRVWVTGQEDARRLIDSDARKILFRDLAAHLDFAAARQAEQGSPPGAAVWPTSAVRVSTRPSGRARISVMLRRACASASCAAATFTRASSVAAAARRLSISSADSAPAASNSLGTAVFGRRECCLRARLLE